MKQSLLEIVQDVLNDMDSDEVNSIDDTIESTQVAQIVKSTYFAMISNRDWPHTRKILQFNASASSDYPTHMTLPDGVKRVCFINYNRTKPNETRKRYGPIKYAYPDDFMRRQNQLNSDSPDVDIIVDPTGVNLLIKNDKQPDYYTSFDDTSIVFDSYDKVVDDTIQNSKVQAMAYVMPLWEHRDSFIPDLPAEAFTALAEESKSKAAFKLRQFQDVKSEQEAGRQQRWLSRNVKRIDRGIKYPNYGRNNRKFHKDPTFRGDR